MPTRRFLGLLILLLGIALLVGAAVLYVELHGSAGRGTLELSPYSDYMVESVVVPLYRGWCDLIGASAPGPAQFAGAVRNFCFLMGLVGLVLVGVSTWILARGRGSDDSGAAADTM